MSTYAVKRGNEVIAHKDIYTPKNQSRLGAWRQNKHVSYNCCCNPSAQQLSSVSIGGRIHLRAWPDTKPYHHPECKFYGQPEAQLTTNHLSSKAFKKNEDTGDIEISCELKLSMESKSNIIATQVQPPNPNRKHVQQDQVTTLGFLQILVEESNINYYAPLGKRKIQCYQDVITSMLRLSKKVKFNKEPLSNYLAFLGSSDEERQDKWFNKIALKFIGEPNKRFIVVAPISGFTKTERGYGVSISGHKRKIFCDSILVDNFVKSFENATKAAFSDTDICLGIFHCRWSPKEYLLCEAMAGMPLDQHFLPYDSDYEKEMLAHAVNKERWFIKPVRQSYDMTKHPDLILLDTEKRLHIEVCGMMNNEGYVASLENKIQYYEDNNFDYMCWNPKDPLPSFPPKAPWYRTDSV